MKPKSVFNHPSLRESISFIKNLNKPTVAELLSTAQHQNKTLIQPRCGVGSHQEMKRLLRKVEKESSVDISTLTIDSYTRLNKFDKAFNVLKSNPKDLNGYPLCAHGWERGRELNAATDSPIQVRHGSPQPELLFDTSIASGITAFEGGGISYNIPYCKDVSLEDSLASWAYVDRTCGELAKEGIIVDRELFGSLTGVLTPPSISIAITLLEAITATSHGVACISVSYPQTGCLTQDIAALRAIRSLERRYLPSNVAVHPVLHQFMGVFPKKYYDASSLILLGGLTARLGKADKIITKTTQEAEGVPTTEAIIEGLLITKSAASSVFDFLTFDQSQVEEEEYWIVKEVREIIDSVLSLDENISSAICTAFKNGMLDVPFAASIHANRDIVPVRDSTGAIRYLSHGNLCFSDEVNYRNSTCLKFNNNTDHSDSDSQIQDTINSINHFSNYSNE